MTDGVQYAGFLRRLAAFVIDSLILLILLTPLLYFFTGGDYYPGLDPEADFTAQLAVVKFDWSYLLFNDLLPMALVIFFWLRYRGTPGKQIMDCEVVDATTFDNLRIGQAILRYFGYFLSMLPLGLGFLWIIWDRKKRGFHDLLAHTVVIVADRSHDPVAEEPLDKLMKEVE
ncbi:MAG: RDD family protein [Gammaproteobacteria bacterium]